MFTSEVVVLDPTSGATVSKHLMPDDLHGVLDDVTWIGPSSAGADLQGELIDDDGRFASLSGDGRTVAVLARENPTERAPSPPLRLVVHDLSGTLPPRVIELDGMEVPWRIDWAGPDVVLTYADGDRASGLTTDTHLEARRVAVPVASAGDPASTSAGSGSTVTDPRSVPDAGDDTDPVAAATQIGLVPVVLGEPVRATASIRTVAEVVIEPAAAHPVLTQTSVPRGGRPFPAPVDRSWVWVIAVLGALGVAIGAVWQQRRATRGRNDPWLRW